METNTLNSIRTSLLISINKELFSLKRNCKTKIHSRTLNEFENIFYSSYDNIIKLKEESFIPQNITREVIQEKKAISKCNLQSPDNLELKFSNKFTQSSKIIPFLKINNKEENLDNTIYSPKILGKKSLSTMKNNYFKMKMKEQIPKGKKILLKFTKKN